MILKDHRAEDSPPPSVEDVCVDHRGRDVAVAKQLLDRADVVSVLEKMCGERVPLMPLAA